MFFKKKKIGITRQELYEITSRIVNLYDEAHKRQDPLTKKPSAYMKGVSDALQIIFDVEPHVL